MLQGLVGTDHFRDQGKHHIHDINLSFQKNQATDKDYKHKH